jgi:FHA domain/von Willebrand factor type A domain
MPARVRALTGATPGRCYGFSMSFRRTSAPWLLTIGAMAPTAPALAASASPDAVTVALVLDTSASIRKDELERTRALCVGLLEHLPAGSEAALFTFDDQDRLLLPWTTASSDLQHALSIVRPTGHFTLLYDALYDASRHLRDAPARRKALVLLTDGKDEGSTLDLEDGLRAAQDRFPVFTIGVGRVQERILRRIAKLTGGEYLPIADATSEALRVGILRTALVPAAAEQAAPPASPAASGQTQPAAASRTGATRAQPLAPARRGRLWLGLGALVVLAASVGFVTLRRRARPRCPSCNFEVASALGPCTYCSAEANARITEHASVERPQPTLISPPAARATAMGRSETMLARLNNTEEFLEKTVTLREQPVLVITGGPGSGRVFSLSETITSLGRAKANDIVLEDISVSSEHCRIRPENGAFIVHDLKSTNGTYVNERKITHHPLNAGDVLKLGETSLQYRLDHQRAS